MKPDWNKLDKARLDAAQDQYDSQVIYPDDIPSVETWDCYNPSYGVGDMVMYHGVMHRVIDAGKQGLRLAAFSHHRL